MSAPSHPNNTTLSKLPSPNNYNNLISLQLDPQQLMNMPESQKQLYFDKIKKQANYFLLNAFRALQDKNYTLAKDILVYIADSCSCIHPPDKESEQLIELCCEQLAQIKRVDDWVDERRITKKVLNQNGQRHKKIELFVMKYNKFSGQFQCDQSDKNNINTQVLFYLSKINAILFGEQTTESIHSMIAMLKMYSIQMILTLILILLLVLLEMTNLKNSFFQLRESSNNYPAFICGIGFLFPLLVIFFKSPLTKNSQFFQLKLTEEIKKINQECREQGKKILFMMPEGMELNVKVQHEFDEIMELEEDADGVMIDLSRIRKRVTHFYQKNNVDGQVVLVK